MLAKNHARLEVGQSITIQKFKGGEDVSRRGAFAWGDKIRFCITVPRRFGCAAVVLRIAPDGGESCDLPLWFSERVGDADVYTVDIKTETLCRDAHGGLFYYEFLFLRGLDTLFTDSENNVDFSLSNHSERKFKLFVYEKDFHTPQWFWGGTMYHVFVDRFCRGEGQATLRDDAVLETDWENGIPQFAKKNGDPLKNNVFFGGNLWGVIEKLDYLASLGVTVLYLSPIFESASNHRYDTGDYEKVDALLGGDEAFDALVREAHARDIKIVLDGVFNHTGDDSVYFNRRENYPTVGAYQSESSRYAPWYQFDRFPDRYSCWWGIDILPRLHQDRAACRNYFTGAEGIVAKWLERGADGWRLDVADELCDDFLDELRATTKSVTSGEGLIIGEVWENAVDKISYGNRRRYFGGRQLDSVMNYPVRNAILALVADRDTETFYNILTELYSSYPPEVCNSLMNLLGTHDTERILTLLGDPTRGEELSNTAKSTKCLGAQARAKAIELLKIASVLQFTVFGVPSVYYGDEAGLEGYGDPFCRMPYPWGREDASLVEHYRMLGQLRANHRALRDGDFQFLYHDEDCVVYERCSTRDRVRIAINLNPTKEKRLEILPDAVKPLSFAIFEG